MTLTAFLPSALFDGVSRQRDRAVLVKGETVVAVVEPGDLPESAKRVAFDGLLAPGFIDLQVNGGGGVLFNNDPTVDGVRTITTAHARYGTTALLPTLITDTPEVTAAAVRAIRDAIAAKVPGCLGVHLEGPHLSIARKGAHNPAYIRPMDEADFERITSTGIAHVLSTIAPETVPPAMIKRLADAGILVSMGHSDASFEVALDAVRAGARSVTHLFNAMSQLGHRTPGVVGAALESGDLWCGLIADGHHVHPASIDAALRAKNGPARIVLVTDAMSTVGSSQKSFELNGRTITREGGRLTLSDGTLAGSDLDMISGIRFMIERIGVALDEALRMASLYPAMALGIDRTHGRIAAGSRADFVHLTKDLDVADVFIGGERQVFTPIV